MRDLIWDDWNPAYDPDLRQRISKKMQKNFQVFLETSCGLKTTGKKPFLKEFSIWIVFSHG
jgi:hypothetical protein